MSHCYSLNHPSRSSGQVVRVSILDRSKALSHTMPISISAHSQSNCFSHPLAGLLSAGDQIHAINGQSIHGMPPDDIVQMLVSEAMFSFFQF